MNTSTAPTAAKPKNQATLGENIARIFEQQRAHHPVVAATTAKQRIQKLKKLRDAIYARRTEIQEAMYKDFKKPAPEVDLTETFVAISEAKHAIRHLRKWMKPKRVRPTLATLTTRGWIRYEPRGVVLIISPWNFPFNLTMGPLISAIAAGNCAIVKPSEFTPHTTKLMREMMAELFPRDEVAFFEGGPEVARELLQYKFDHIFFTGSTRVGKIIMKAAAENLTTVTLELGGKSPVIIDETAHIDDAAKKIAWGKYMNKGQTCIAPDYLLVHEKVYDAFLLNLKKHISHFYGQNEAERIQCIHYPRIISPHHHSRLTAMISDAVEKGATLEVGGTIVSEQNYISPTVLTNITLDSTVMKEEIFGPVLPLIRYRSIEETLPIINERDNPLALYIFSRNRRNIDAIISRTSAGGTCINDIALHFLHLNLPFGGVNNSGHGNSHGYYGFKAFSHERAVLKHSHYSPLKLMYPPYTKFVQKLIDLTIKYL